VAASFPVDTRVEQDDIGLAPLDPPTQLSICGSDPVSTANFAVDPEYLQETFLSTPSIYRKICMRRIAPVVELLGFVLIGVFCWFVWPPLPLAWAGFILILWANVRGAPPRVDRQ
jgi:hypothetical protein